MIRKVRPKALLARLLSRAVARAMPPRQLEDVLADGYVRVCAAGVADRRALEALCAAARQLPERPRRVLLLKKAYGLSQPEIARALGIRRSTVESELALAVQHCFELTRRRAPAPARATRRRTADG